MKRSISAKSHLHVRFLRYNFVSSFIKQAEVEAVVVAVVCEAAATSVTQRHAGAPEGSDEVTDLSRTCIK